MKFERIVIITLTILLVGVVIFAGRPKEPSYDPIPSGTIWIYSGTTAPYGWILCDGTAINRTTYASLFAIISTTYGSGNGTTTFNIPDLRQRFPLGKAVSGTGATLGGTGGLIDHTHSVTPVPLNSISLIGVGTGADDNTVTSGTANPPFLAVNYIIKL